MLYATTLYGFAGLVTGSAFKARTLLLVSGLVLIEALFLSANATLWRGAVWALINLTAVQVGYVAGLFGRGLLEQVGFSLPALKIRRR